jgi:hypothetical protein
MYVFQCQGFEVRPGADIGKTVNFETKTLVTAPV